MRPKSPALAPENDADQMVSVEEFKTSGDALAAKMQDLIRQGNIRRIIIKNKEGHTLIKVPSTIDVIGGAIGTALFPVVLAIGVIRAMVAHLTAVIQKQR